MKTIFSGFYGGQEIVQETDETTQTRQQEVKGSLSLKNQKDSFFLLPSSQV
jgi:hypothetical protein